MAKRGRKSTGSIRQRGDCFQARITNGGVTLEQSLATRAEAIAWLQRIRVGVEEPKLLEVIAEAQRLTLRQAMDKYRASRITKDARRADSLNDRKDLQRHDLVVSLASDAQLESFVTKPLYSVRSTHINAYIDARLEMDASPATINRELNHFSRAFTYAAARLNCDGLFNPVTPRMRLPEPRGRNRRFRKDEQEILFRHAEIYEATGSVPLRAFISFACDTAMRFGEITGMRWEHVDFEQQVVLLPHTKNGDIRSVPLWPQVIDLLQALKPQKRGPVWPEAEAIRSAYRRARDSAAEEARRTQEAGDDLADRLATLRLHDFRHEGVSRWIERTGWSTPEIMAITGHKSPAMLARYTHLYAVDMARRLRELVGHEMASRRGLKFDDALSTTLPAEVQQRAAWKYVMKNLDLLEVLAENLPKAQIASEFGVTALTVERALEKTRGTAGAPATGAAMPLGAPDAANDPHYLELAR